MKNFFNRAEVVSFDAIRFDFGAIRFDVDAIRFAAKALRFPFVGPRLQRDHRRNLREGFAFRFGAIRFAAFASIFSFSLLFSFSLYSHLFDDGLAVGGGDAQQQDAGGTCGKAEGGLVGAEQRVAQGVGNDDVSYGTADLDR